MFSLASRWGRSRLRRKPGSILQKQWTACQADGNQKGIIWVTLDDPVAQWAKLLNQRKEPEFILAGIQSMEDLKKGKGNGHIGWGGQMQGVV